jgi:serine phosphatase RsbU (regulator of sigma subunit)
VQLAPGDRLLLFTDGITEAAKPDGEEFGEERLVGVALQCAEKSTSETKTQLLARVKEYCDSQLCDDATLIVISVLGAGEERGKVVPEMCAAV